MNIYTNTIAFFFLDWKIWDNMRLLLRWFWERLWLFDGVRRGCCGGLLSQVKMGNAPLLGMLQTPANPCLDISGDYDAFEYKI